ncbi:LicD family-domain-containing protein [Chaetomidium leptoderma]|uniref:LicD family-domain-containing protein n=1 Tax=Chaetomidium leptoderma TaxID=669021 RepID=A0AAN6VJR8_9PEZI|nr:LicD family-domain-containing protein [Chaetomidium leptoderma]
MHFVDDARFAKRELSSPQRHTALENLVRTYLATLDDLGIETWLMHRALLGWWWGKHVLPSDLDLSVQVSEPAIFFLAAYYNMSTFSSKSADTSHRRRYLLELSPYAKDREHRDWSNAADARWIDTESGLSIDVYAVRYNLTHPGGEGMLSCKDGSEIKDTYLFPLRNTTFEGVPAKIPYRYEELLVIEYGADALKEIGHNDYHFDHDDMRWVLKEKLPANAEGSQKTVNHVGAGEL